MRHISLTCKNHPELRWSCKEIAFTDRGGYNGCRNIFFFGVLTGERYDDGTAKIETFHDGVTITECTCPSRDLVRAPEDRDEERMEQEARA